VCLGGAFADVHGLADLRVGQPVPDLGEDVEFLLGEHGQPASGLDDAGRPPARCKWSISRRVIAGERIDSPRAAMRTAWIRSSGGVSLSRNPAAAGPQRAGDVRVLAEVVSMTT